ncbi:MAG TPA: hypothetical protein ENN40_03225 [Candidatus Aminicenantes bacterium]|nr:hypothetical protein [Candidatus Aminicenantes bacterium]
MNHALAVFTTGLGILFAVTGCSDGNYTDLRQVMEKQAEVVEETTKKLAAARNTADVVAEVDRFSAAMDQLAPRAQQLSAKYPEAMEALSRGRVPDSLGPIMRRVNELETDFFRTATGMIRFVGDPQVEAARRKFEQAMQTLAWRLSDPPRQNP